MGRIRGIIEFYLFVRLCRRNKTSGRRYSTRRRIRIILPIDGECKLYLRSGRTAKRRGRESRRARINSEQYRKPFEIWQSAHGQYNKTDIRLFYHVRHNIVHFVRHRNTRGNLLYVLLYPL